MQGGPIQSPVGELRSHMPCGSQKKEAVLHVFIWNDLQDILHEKKERTRTVCIVYYHFYFSLIQVFINIYGGYIQNVSGRIHKKQV